jgi:hypothetical protein
LSKPLMTSALSRVKQVGALGPEVFVGRNKKEHRRGEEKMMETTEGEGVDGYWLNVPLSRRMESAVRGWL